MIKNGIVYPSCEIYGGLKGFYDYGYLGKLLKNNFENLWRSYFLSLHENFWEVEPTLIMHEKVFIASGHLEKFNDPMVECKKCKERFRADKLIEEKLGISCEGKSIEELNKLIKENNIRCPVCGGELSEVKWFNLMFPIVIGPSSFEFFKIIEDSIKSGKLDIEKVKNKFNEIISNTAYLRPETAQGAYILFKREFEVHRRKLPLGLAIIGKAFRNEISPRQLLIRMREFTQAELQIFFDPNDWENNFEKEFNFEAIKDYKINVLLVSDRDKNIDYRSISAKELVEKYSFPKFYVYFLTITFRFFVDLLHIPKERIRLKELSEDEKAFYNKYHFDVEIYFESLKSWKEVAGIHYRTDHDLSGHQKVSKQKLSVKREDGTEFIPHVLEISFGVDRNIMALIDVFLCKEKLESGSERVVLKIPYSLAPIHVAVFPLVSNKKEIVEKAKKVYEIIKNMKKYKVIYDEKGSIGKRYRRMDEIGTPICITIDYQTLEDDTVTIRFRDNMKQIRVKIDELGSKLSEIFSF